MLDWSQIKPLIRELVSPVFLEMGFEQPGVCMWRHREKFVDVVEFRVPRAQQMQIVFGSSPRLKGINNPHYWECSFNSAPLTHFGVNPRLLSFGADEERQRENLVLLADRLREPAQRWFAYFDTVVSARLALERNEVFGPCHVFDGNPGSLAYLEIATALNSISGFQVREET